MMLHSLGDPDTQIIFRERFQDVFGPLKSLDSHLQFVFITGISKFSQMGIFSKLNNLENISMQPAYETICGISEEELTTQMRPDLEIMAVNLGYTYDEMLTELKRMYDGYHFGNRMVDMYNPFSIVNALKSENIDKYWFDSATPSALIAMLREMPPLEISDVDGAECESGDFNRAFDSYQSPLPILYQSGYLTIKRYDKDIDLYTLGFPNEEVRKGFAKCSGETMICPPLLRLSRRSTLVCHTSGSRTTATSIITMPCSTRCSWPLELMSVPRNLALKDAATSPCLCRRASTS